MKIFQSYLFLFLLVLVLNVKAAYAPATVMGPVVIDIPGYDKDAGILYFTRTNWGECDCNTDLYIYRIAQNDLEIIPDWSDRNTYRKNREDVLIEKGLSHLDPVDPTRLPAFVSFKWDEPVEYYSKVLLEETTSYPFKIIIHNRAFEYYQCYEKKSHK